jgi:hypothetical protein
MPQQKTESRFLNPTRRRASSIGVGGRSFAVDELKELGVSRTTILHFRALIEARYAKAKVHVDKLTQSILAKAFRGELVPQDPNDEPASVLLKRIRSAHQHSNTSAVMAT